MSFTKNLHTGHRSRMRERFVSSGRELNSFSDHEAVEMLLFSCCPRSNTNETAHKLMNRFGSISGVLSADREELESISGVGSQTALFLNICGALKDFVYKSDE